MEDESTIYEVTFYETRLPFDLRKVLTRRVSIGKPLSTFEKLRMILAVTLYGKQEPELIHVLSLAEVTE